MQQRIVIYSDFMEREFDHGTLESVRINAEETKLIIESSLVVSRDQSAEFKKELEELIKRYAL